MKSRYEGLQNRLWGVREGCFFITLLSIAEEERERLKMTHVKVDFVDAVNVAFEKGWLKSDYTVVNDIAILSWLTGEKVTKEVVDRLGIVKGNQYTVAKWLSKAGNSNHFRRRGWDVYQGSVTVRDGTLMCYYVYTFKE